MLIDRRTRHSVASRQALFAIFSRLGGTQGWLYADSLWEVRGVFNRIVGGISRPPGRRSESELRIGDTVDSWRVEGFRQNEFLRLHAEMRLPGEGWLQFEALAHPSGGSTLRQTALFEPRGLFGRAYWYALMPFHARVFGSLAKRIVEEAEILEGPLVGAGTDYAAR